MDISDSISLNNEDGKEDSLSPEKNNNKKNSDEFDLDKIFGQK